ncbi:MAG: hypothetical protein ABFD65_00675 [Candidatus Polarisedimenticolia bacterium]
MARGHNSDVLFDGTVFHVQSEHRGEDEPLVETLVYCGGQILHQERSTLADLPADAAGAEEAQRRLERQHRDVVRRVRHGEFFVERRETLLDLWPEDGPCDELVAGRLRELEGAAALALRFEPDRPDSLRGRLFVARADDGRPVEGAAAAARLVLRDGAPRELWRGETARDGSAMVAADIPADAPGSIVFRAEKGTAEGRLRFDPTASRPARRGGEKERVR